MKNMNDSFANPPLLSDVANMLVLFIDFAEPHLIFDYVHMEFFI